MKLTITKKEVIKAIKTESLKAGVFFDLDDFFGEFNPETCKVCAVGAVLRQAGQLPKNEYEYGIKHRNGCDLGNRATRGVASTFQLVNNPRKSKNINFLSMLSCEFEDLMADRKRVSKKDRQYLIDFTKAFCPESFTVNL